MTYCLDFREIVMDYKAKEGLTFEQTSHHFGVGIRTLFRWNKALSPCRHRQKPATKIDMDALKADIQDWPDDYQWERAKRLGVSQSCIHYALKRLGVSYKKTLKHSKANDQARTEFKKKIAHYESSGQTIIYLDESGFAVDSPRTHGYSKKGQRCYGTQDWHAKGRTNAIGAIESHLNKL